MNDSRIKAVMLRDGLESVGNSPEQFAALIRAEISKWRKLVKVAGIPQE